MLLKISHEETASHSGLLNFMSTATRRVGHAVLSVPYKAFTEQCDKLEFSIT